MSFMKIEVCKAKTEAIIWFPTVTLDLDSAGITQANMTNRETVRQQVFDWLIFQRG